jgi:hypothetical protein
MYLVPRGWDPAAEDADDQIVYVFEHGRSHIKVASELWGLCDAPRGAEIDALMTRAYERDPHRLDQPDIATLLRLLDGLEDSLSMSWVDEHWNVPSERIPELKRRATMLEIDDVEGVVPESAIAAGLSRVGIARDILRTALDEQLNILLD